MRTGAVCGPRLPPPLVEFARQCGFAFCRLCLRILALPATVYRLGLILFLALITAASWAWYEIGRPLQVPGGSVEVRVASGATARSIARQLREVGVSVNAWEFVLVATVSRATHSLRAGRYRIGSGINMAGLVEKFRRGDVLREQLTIVEGSTFEDVRAAFAQCQDLRHDTADWSEAQILHAVGAPEAHAEGLFAPDTYLFDPGSSDVELYRQAYLAQKERIESAWQGRAPDLPYANSYQALIMASIIEKETGRSEERGRVAAVFVNRQRLGMPLQTDPAVIYGLGSRFDGRLHKRDLQSDTPYNTYLRAGLPPTPISLPGRAALEAALNPEPVKALYFVARGDGSSEFSSTLAEHNRAVERFQRAGTHPQTH